MSKTSSPKNRGGDKDFATKNTMNPIGHERGEPPRGGSEEKSLPNEPNSQDVKRRIGQFGGTGNPNLIKK